jgi:hypothetical protein
MIDTSSRTFRTEGVHRDTSREISTPLCPRILDAQQ